MSVFFNRTLSHFLILQRVYNYCFFISIKYFKCFLSSKLDNNVTEDMPCLQLFLYHFFIVHRKYALYSKIKMLQSYKCNSFLLSTV